MQEFLKKEQWFKENWMSISKTHNWGIIDLNKQENYLRYRTYYQNDYNPDKDNRRSNYRSNTGHRGEEHRYNRSPRQDNSKNVITFQQANSK